MILLMGQRSGAFPDLEHVKALGPVSEYDRYCQATGQTRASYTQWEYLLAKHLGKDTYVFLPEPSLTPHQPDAEDADSLAVQADFVRWVKRRGEHRGTFADERELRLNVARLKLSGDEPDRPVLLPYASLGDLFMGRDEELEQLHAALRGGTRAPEATVTIQAICGSAALARPDWLSSMLIGIGATTGQCSLSAQGARTSFVGVSPGSLSPMC